MAYPWREDADLPEEEGGPPKPNPIEQGIVLAANAVWAVVGLLLWLPQLARVVLVAAVRVVHSALTRQPVEAVRGPIRRVSRFYVDGFLKPGRTWSQGVFSARDLALPRLLGEAAWAGVFYLFLLRLFDPIGFGAIWSRLTDWAARALLALGDLGARLFQLLPQALRDLRELPNALRLTLVGLVLLALLGGFLLGRGRQRRR